MSCHPNCPTSPPVSPPNTYSTSKHTHHCLQVVTACREDYRHCLNINHVLIDGIPAHPFFFSVVVVSVIRKRKKKTYMLSFYNSLLHSKIQKNTSGNSRSQAFTTEFLIQWKPSYQQLEIKNKNIQFGGRRTEL